MNPQKKCFTPLYFFRKLSEQQNISILNGVFAQIYKIVEEILPSSDLQNVENVKLLLVANRQKLMPKFERLLILFVFLIPMKKIA